MEILRHPDIEKLDLNKQCVSKITILYNYTSKRLTISQTLTNYFGKVYLNKETGYYEISQKDSEVFIPEGITIEKYNGMLEISKSVENSPNREELNLELIEMSKTFLDKYEFELAESRQLKLTGKEKEISKWVEDMKKYLNHCENVYAKNKEIYKQNIETELFKE